MYRFSVCFAVCLLMMCCVLPISAQQPAAAANGVVPPMVKFSGVLTDVNSKPLTGLVGVTFSLYKDSQGGAPLWLETQNVQIDKNGHYSVMLGSTSSPGLPGNLFVSGEARWLGVQAQGQAELPRTLLMSVPYALKAADAETLGGKPLSAFQLAAPQFNNGGRQKVQPAAEQPNEIRCAGSAACKTNFVPVFSTNGGSAKVNNSIISQSGSAVTISGSDNITGNETVAGNVMATNVAATGRLTATATSGNGNAISGSSANPTATVIYGGASSTTGATWAVEGDQYSSDPGASGVVGVARNGGIGVTGLNSVAGGGAAVYGQMVKPITSNFSPPAAGVWGSTGNSGSTGVLGTADDGSAGFFINNPPSGFYTLVAESYDSSGRLFLAYNISNGVACAIDAAAHLHCDGGIGAMVPIDGGKRKVALSAIESPENWFEDFGSAQLINGIAVIQLDPDFIQTVNTEKDYSVFPVPNGDCKGLYVTNKSANSFEVHELGAGASNIRFDYRITAIRRKYETVRFADHTNDLAPRKMPEQMRKAKPASSPDQATVKPTSQPGVGVPVAQLSNK
jgi:hypothetical protein